MEGPESPSLFSTWFDRISQHRKDFNFGSGVFDNSALQWTQTSFIQPQTMIFDRFLWDNETGEFTVKRFLNDLIDRFGGIDSVLLWPAYPQIGVDDRNQYDYVRALPGGLEAMLRLTRELHSAGVRVLWPYNPWDKTTRRELDCDGEQGTSQSCGLLDVQSEIPDDQVLARMMKQIDADGFNADTMKNVPESFWDESVSEDHPLAIEPEMGGDDKDIYWHTLGWGYWEFVTHVPLVDRYKFLTHGKYMTHTCDRWALNKTDLLQPSWFNGAGFESWENIFGTWNGLSPRDGEATRRMATMSRFLSGEAHVLRSRGWVPHCPDTVQHDVFASRFPADNQTRFGIRNAWALVNRAGKSVSGTQLVVEPTSADSNFFDCYHGVALETEAASDASSSVRLSFEIEREGFGCVIEVVEEKINDGGDRVVVQDAESVSCAAAVVEANLSIIAGQGGTHTDTAACSASSISLSGTADPSGNAIGSFLSRMSEITANPLSSYSHDWKYETQTMVSNPATTSHQARWNMDMVLMPGTDHYHFLCQDLLKEPGPGSGVQFPWESYPRRQHFKILKVPSFYMHKSPVTNAQYHRYMLDTQYEPADKFNYLKQWNGRSSPPDSISDMPVTHVGLSEARKYTY